MPAILLTGFATNAAEIAAGGTGPALSPYCVSRFRAITLWIWCRFCWMLRRLRIGPGGTALADYGIIYQAASNNATYRRRAIDLTRIGVHPAVVHGADRDFIQLLRLHAHVAQRCRQAQACDQCRDRIARRHVGPPQCLADPLLPFGFTAWLKRSTCGSMMQEV